MSTATDQRRSPLGSFYDRSAPRLYDRIEGVVRARRRKRAGWHDRSAKGG